MALLRRQKLIIISLVFYWPTLFVLAHIPIPRLVRKAGVSDKSLHFLAYLILIFLLWFATRSSNKVDWRRATVWWVLLAAVSYGVFDELLQRCVAGRSCDIMDFSANLAGVLTGLILLSFFTFWPALLVLTGTTIFGLTNLTRANLADLLPVTNALFHFFAYGLFTILWIQNTYPSALVKGPKPKWLIPILGPPIGFLLAVKLFSIILGKDFDIQDVIASLAGITVVIAVILLIPLIRKRLTKTEQLSLPDA